MANLPNVEVLEKHLKENPNSVVFALVAKHYLERGDVERALALCEEGVRKHPQYDFGHYVLALCWYEKKDFKQAREHLELALALNEKNPAAWKLLGEVNSKLNQPQQAQEASARYYALDMFNPDAAERMEQTSLLELSLFEENESTAPESSVETSAGEEFLQEEQFETLFEEADAELSTTATAGEEEVEDVLRETLGDLSSLDQGESPPERGETLDIGEAASSSAEQEEEKDFSSAIDYFFSEIEEEEETRAGESGDREGDVEEASSESSDRPGKTEPEDSLLEEGEKELEPEAAQEEEPGEAETAEEDLLSGGDEEELLDFSSVVENIISDRKEELSGTSEDEASGATSMTIIHQEEDETGESAAEAGEERISLQPEAEGAEGEEEDFTLDDLESSLPTESTQFGKPPIVSPTLGEIYIAQGRFEEAIEVFQKLLEKEPDNPKYRKKIQFIQELQNKQQSGEYGDQG